MLGDYSQASEALCSVLRRPLSLGSCDQFYTGEGAAWMTGSRRWIPLSTRCNPGRACMLEQELGMQCCQTDLP